MSEVTKAPDPVTFPKTPERVSAASPEQKAKRVRTEQILSDLKTLKNLGKRGMEYLAGKIKPKETNGKSPEEQREDMVTFAEKVKASGGSETDQLAALAYETHPTEPGREEVLKQYNHIVEGLTQETPKQALEIKTYGNTEVLDLLANRNRLTTQDRKLVVILPGGGLAGIVGAGLLEGLVKTGTIDNVDGFLGASAGSTALPFIGTGRTAEGPGLYEHLAASSDFIKLPRTNPVDTINALWKLYQEGPQAAIVDTAVAGKTMRTTLTQDAEKISQYDKELNAIVMDTKTGKPLVVDIRKMDDPFSAIEASTCIPGVSSQKSVSLAYEGATIDAADGDYAAPMGHAVDIAFSQLGATDVLVLANFSLANKGLAASLESLAASVLANGYEYSDGVKDTLRRQDELWNDGLTKMLTHLKAKDPNRRLAIMAPSKGGVAPLEKNPAIFKDTHKQAENFSASIISNHKKTIQQAA